MILNDAKILANPICPYSLSTYSLNSVTNLPSSWIKFSRFTWDSISTKKYLFLNLIIILDKNYLIIYSGNLLTTKFTFPNELS